MPSAKVHQEEIRHYGGNSRDWFNELHTYTCSECEVEVEKEEDRPDQQGGDSGNMYGNRDPQWMPFYPYRYCPHCGVKWETYEVSTVRGREEAKKAARLRT